MEKNVDLWSIDFIPMIAIHYTHEQQLLKGVRNEHSAHNEALSENWFERRLTFFIFIYFLYRIFTSSFQQHQQQNISFAFM